MKMFKRCATKKAHSRTELVRAEKEAEIQKAVVTFADATLTPSNGRPFVGESEPYSGGDLMIKPEDDPTFYRDDSRPAPDSEEGIRLGREANRRTLMKLVNMFPLPNTKIRHTMTIERDLTEIG